MFFSARPIFDNPTSSLAPKLAEGNTAFPGHMSAGMDGFVGSVVLGTGEPVAFDACRLKAASRESISAFVNLAALFIVFLLVRVAGRRELLRPDARGEMGLIILVGELAPFLRLLDRVGVDGLLLSDKPCTEMLSGVYFCVLIAPVSTLR